MKGGYAGTYPQGGTTGYGNGITMVLYREPPVFPTEIGGFATAGGYTYIGTASVANRKNDGLKYGYLAIGLDVNG